MTTNIERAAEVLRDDKHYKMGAHGEQFLTSKAARSLADAGLLMPDLPAPDIGEISGIADWRVNSWDVSVYPDSNGHPAMIHIENRTRMTKPYVFNSQKAREFGEAMIAAANHAEQENKKMSEAESRALASVWSPDPDECRGCGNHNCDGSCWQ